MGELKGLDLGRLFGDLGGMLAALVGLSFVFGYVGYKSYLDIFGLGWYASSLGTTEHAIKAVESFLVLAPSTVSGYVVIKVASQKINLKICLFSVCVVVLSCGLYIEWLYFSKLGSGSLQVAGLAVKILGFMSIVIGSAAGMLLYLFGVAVNRKWGVFLVLVMSLYCIFVLVPYMSGVSKGFIVQYYKGGKLPYVLIGDDRWAVLDYKEGRSLLLRYTLNSYPEARLEPIETLVIRRDGGSKFSFEKPESSNLHR